MAHSIREDSGLYSYGDAASNVTAFLADTLPSDFSLLHSKVVWGFSLVLVLVLAKVFGSKDKLPAGAKRLPYLPGKLYLLTSIMVCADGTIRSSFRYWSFLGDPNSRRRGSMVFR